MSRQFLSTLRGGVYRHRRGLMTDNDSDARALDEIIATGANLPPAERRVYVEREIQRLFEQARIRVAADKAGEQAAVLARVADATPS